MKRLLVVLAVFVVFGPVVVLTGAGGPPVVTIYYLTTMEAIDSLAVNVDEMFTLVGSAVGDTPLRYFWYEDVLLATGSVLMDYSFSEPGDYVITLEVIDRNGLSGFDSVFVIVQGVPVPIQATTWGRIKALYE